MTHYGRSEKEFFYLINSHLDENIALEIPVLIPVELVWPLLCVKILFGKENDQ